MAEQRMDAAGNGAAWRIGVDVGGTFTDLVAVDGAGAIHVFKVPSIAEDPAQGVLDALGLAADNLALPLADLLGACTLFVHGTTVATNTVLEGKGARVGLLTTEGFRDSLEIRRGHRPNPWDHRTPYPPVLVPRYLRLAVGGRIDRDGNQVAALEAADVEAADRAFAAEDVESVAICLFNSFLNPDHERRAAETLARAGNREWISVSSDIAPMMGEYERTSTTVVNAYVAPRTVGYLHRLDRTLGENGLGHSMLLIQNNGGAVSVGQLANKPATVLLSGPAAGVGALEYYRRAVGSDNLISMEIGGTSCDVILMRGGAVPVTDQLVVGGYEMALPSVDVHTIGAGGGTIAGVDAGGMLFAGPQGAGARPGPAAYGFGGTEPTVTDAQLVLGRLRPGPYAGGSVSLDAELARQAIERAVATPLGIDVEAAAAGIIRLVEQNLLQAVRQISIERGHDPRRFVLVAAGGAGPMHGAAIGRALGCPKAYLPRLSGVFCALGMLHSNVRHDFVRAHLRRLDEADGAELVDLFEGLEGQARTTLEAEGFTTGAMRLERQLDLRYIGQQWDVRVPLANGAAPGAAAVRAAFEAEHDRLYGHHQPGGIVEITKLRSVAIGLLAPLEAPDRAAATDAATPVEQRRAYLGAEHGWGSVDVYAGAELMAGHRLDGPLLVEEETATMYVGPDDVLEVDAAGDFLVHLPAETSP
jgi:N-methylhydantoinase A